MDEQQEEAWMARMTLLVCLAVVGVVGLLWSAP